MRERRVPSSRGTKKRQAEARTCDVYKRQVWSYGDQYFVVEACDYAIAYAVAQGLKIIWKIGRAHV